MENDDKRAKRRKQRRKLIDNEQRSRINARFLKVSLNITVL